MLPSILQSRHFFEIVSLVSSEFLLGARNPYEVVHDRARFSGKNFFPKMDQKQGFLNLLEDLVINFY